MTRILLAEGSPAQAEALLLLFQSKGFELDIVADGEEALAHLAASPFDVVLSDIAMPGLSGHEVCRRIKSDPRTSEIPVILLASLQDPTSILQGLECGADGFVLEPCEPERLLGRVRVTLERKANRAKHRTRTGAEATFMGRRFTVSSDKEQLLDLLVCTFEDIARTNRDFEARQLELSRASEAMQRLLRIAAGLTGAGTVKEVAEQALELALTLPRIGGGWIALRGEGGGLRVVAVRGVPLLQVTPAALEGGCLCQRMVAAGELRSVVNLVECERLERPGGTKERCVHASVPLCVGDRVLGVMNLVPSSHGPLAEDELKTMFEVGQKVAAAIERAANTERLEARVRASDERYRLLVENANDGIAVYDASGTIREVNRRVEEILGQPREEIVGKHIREFWATDTPGELDATLQAMFAAGSLRVADVHLRRPDGKVVRADASGSVVQVAGERLVCVILRDVTDAKHAEEALRKAEAQLRQSQKMEAVGRLAGGVAHDFNNMLAAISGYSDLILMALPETDPIHKDVQEIRKAASRAAGLTRQLLAFSRKQALEPRVIDLNDVLAGLDKMLRRLVGEDVELTLVAARDLGLVRADPGQVEQVVMNLVVNARDAMPRGGKITIETANVELDGDLAKERDVQPGSYALIAVSDTGCGMSPEVRSHLFEPFFTTKEAGKGTGLGLSTAFGIVRQSGGSISVYSEVGRGATFKVLLPLTGASTVTGPPKAPEPRSLSGSETILVVDDEDVVRDIGCRILRARGYTVLEAVSGDAAVLVSEGHQGPIHALLTDVVMPRMSGCELAERLVPRRPEMRVLYMSGYTGSAVADHGLLEAGVNLLLKPFSAEGLARRVRELLDAPLAARPEA